MSISREPSASGTGGGDHFSVLLAEMAREKPDALALRFLGDGENETGSASYAELDRQARTWASGAASCRGLPVLIACLPGMDFIAALIGCWRAGAIAVPCYPPHGRRHRERLKAVLEDSGARHVIAGPESHEALTAMGLEILLPGSGNADFPPLDASATCLLQYTSGSTSTPKGVRISHANLHHQTRETWRGLQPLKLTSALTWLPPYHDMGLVLKILLALESGMPLTIMAPEHFIQSPLRWLQAISRYGAEFSGAPNFAFELSTRAAAGADLNGLDLSRWKAAPCGAERIRPETLERFAETFAGCGFRKEAFLPGYGLAEATLIVAAKRPGTPQRISRGLLSCGPPLEGMEIMIGEHQEILVRGPSVASGYWSAAQESLTHSDGWLPTGDVGFLENGELFIEGRIKDLLILDGVNHAPDDLERASAGASPLLSGTGAAAFSIEEAGREIAVLIQETPVTGDCDYAALCHAIRHEMTEATGVAPGRLALVRQGLLPRTTSGKVQRAATRAAYLEGRLRLLYDDSVNQPADAEVTLDGTVQASFALLCEAIREATGRAAPAPQDDPADHGLGSIDVTRVTAVLKERTGVNLPVGEVFAARSFRSLAETIASRIPDASPARLPLRPPDEEPVLSHSQERMWFLHQLDPASTAYHVFGALEMDGPLDRQALIRAYAAILTRHEILRSRHGNLNGAPVIRIEPTGEALAEGTIALEQLPDRLRDFAGRPFDLARDSPVRALLLETGPERHVLALCAHHIVADGWSIRLLLRELFEGYRQIPPTKPLPSYLDYAFWHRRRIESGSAVEQTAFWKARLAGATGGTTLPLDFPRPAKASATGDAVGITLPADRVQRIAALAATRRATPFAVCLAAFQVLLHRHGSGRAPVIAVPVANRHHPGSGDLIGTLVNTLPYRLEIHDAEDFTTLVGRVRDETFAMLAAQDAPFEKIIEAVQPERMLDTSPLAQVMFDHQEIPYSTEWPGGLRCRPLLTHRGASQFDLSLLYFALPHGHEVYLEYRTELFRRETIAALLDRYMQILEEAVAAPLLPLTAITGLTAPDRAALQTWGTGPVRPDYLQRVPLTLITDAAVKFPRSTAVECGGQKLTYGELIDRACSIAVMLKQAGITRSSRVAVMVERNVQLPAILLGVWMAGAAYVPLDPANPAERLRGILDDQANVPVLVSPGLRSTLPDAVRVIEFDPDTLLSAPEEPASFPPPRPGEPAYILYTSGSTGKPKGVVVSHGALGNFLLSMQEEPGITPEDRLAAVTTISFDISALEIFLPLITGATVDLIPAATTRDGAALKEHLARHPATLLQATPATWRMLLDAGWKGAPQLKILCGGEAMDPALAQALNPCGKEVWNLYGPTETTVWSTLWKVPADCGRVRIGSPIANTTLAIVSPESEAVPPGVTGELLIGGAGLAEGYWQRDELTAEKFIIREGAGYYRTGDLARWLPDGTVDCLGRLDSQVKIRGFRIELGEVEAAMSAHPAVAEAAAAVSAEAGREARILGYYRAQSAVSPDELSRHLRGLLPEYMVPGALLEVTAMPLTSSGKIDRRALLSLAPTSEAAAEKEMSRGVIEGETAAIWQELLQCGPIGRDDDFFALGGHSLLASRMVSQLSARLGITVALDALFEKPTLAAFASRVGERIDPTQPRAVRLHQGPATAPPVFWMHTLIDGGMGLFPYRRAAAMLTEVTSYGIAEGTRPFDSLSEMAARHAAVIRRIQPQGPYRLTGFCFGGNLAAEVAAQLEECGEKVELLVLLEAQPPGARGQVLPWLRPGTWRHFFKRLRQAWKRAAGFDSGTLLKRLGMKHRALAEALARIARDAHGVPDIAAVLDLSNLSPEEQRRARRHWAALHQHPPRLPEHARIVVVRTEDDGWLPRDPALGWGRHAAGRLEMRSVSGRHETFLQETSATQVAALMKEILG